jgi:hypothetical protein
VKNKVKQGELPDKEKWTKYRVRVFVYVGKSYYTVVLLLHYSRMIYNRICCW